MNYCKFHVLDIFIINENKYTGSSYGKQAYLNVLHPSDCQVILELKINIDTVALLSAVTWEILQYLNSKFHFHDNYVNNTVSLTWNDEPRRHSRKQERTGSHCDPKWINAALWKGTLYWRDSYSGNNILPVCIKSWC